MNNAYCTLYTVHCTTMLHCTLNTVHRTPMLHFTLYTVHRTVYTTVHHRYTVYCTPILLWRPFIEVFLSKPLYGPGSVLGDNLPAVGLEVPGQ